MTGKTILIVEDDGIIAARLHDILTRFGYRVPEPMASGEAAVAAVAAAVPDLVLMDIELAGAINGVTAAEHIRVEFDVPIIYLTAYSQAAQLERAKATYPYGYLIKPVVERELLATLEMALHRHALDRRLKESEERLALALWGADLGLWDWDLRADMITCNGPGPNCWGVGRANFNSPTASGNNTFIPAICPPSRMPCARIWTTARPVTAASIACGGRMKTGSGSSSGAR